MTAESDEPSGRHALSPLATGDAHDIASERLDPVQIVGLQTATVVGLDQQRSAARSQFVDELPGAGKASSSVQMSRRPPATTSRAAARFASAARKPYRSSVHARANGGNPHSCLPG